MGGALALNGAFRMVSNGRACCTPTSARKNPEAGADGLSRRLAGAGSHPIEQVAVPAGSFVMGEGTDIANRRDGEHLTHAVYLDAFVIDATTVTNRDFARFVDATGYRTEAERWRVSAVFRHQVQAPTEDVLDSLDGMAWWVAVRGAYWRAPGGALSTVDDLLDHPVVHVSWRDAVAYCQWAGRWLPSEAQWEYASRGGLAGCRYPWGDDVTDDCGAWRCNIWQGDFPHTNLIEDGWRFTAPVEAFAPNGYGLYQTVGNVWEWCGDGFDPEYYARSPLSNPPGPPDVARRVMRGGSFLCHDSYCNRYRNAARTSNTPAASSSNIGFRTIGVRS